MDIIFCKLKDSKHIHLFKHLFSLKSSKISIRFFANFKKVEKHRFDFNMLEKLKNMDLIFWKIQNIKKHEYL